MKGSCIVRLLYAFPLVFLFSCATVERAVPPSGPDLLPGGGDLYISLDVEKSRDAAGELFLPFLGDEKLINTFLDKTDRVSLALFTSGKSPQGFALSAQGNYPVSAISWGLSINREWELVHKKPRIYKQKGTPLNLSLPDSRTLLASSGYMEEMISAYSEGGGMGMPSRVAGVLSSAEFGFYAPVIPPVLAEGIGIDPRLIKTDGIIAVFKNRNEEGYSLSAEILMKSEREARALNALLRLAVLAGRKSQDLTGRPFPMYDARVDFAGSSVFVEGISFTEEIFFELLGMASKGGGISRGSAPPFKVKGPAA